MALQHFTRFFRDERGALSMEFVIAFPLLMILLISSWGFFSAFRAADTHAKVGYAINDIMSRDLVVTTAELDELTIVQRRMLPDTITNQALRISSICLGEGVRRVMWSYTSSEDGVQNWAPLTDETIPHDALPTMVEQDSLILTEMQGVWVPTAGFGIGSLPFSSALAISPRGTEMIVWMGVNEAKTCPRS